MRRRVGSCIPSQYHLAARHPLIRRMSQDNVCSVSSNTLALCIQFVKYSRHCKEMFLIYTSNTRANDMTVLIAVLYSHTIGQAIRLHRRLLDPREARWFVGSGPSEPIDNSTGSSFFVLGFHCGRTTGTAAYDHIHMDD
ncbi:hypothetical protein M408DRAFT_238265 [Serendipita vermifera MAFF 305830]|uniref:Uncharacterized protein n=1 Tax=Serendipita vermifera MAFF 305830 TaxID=933852 RepID=A0A0C2X0F7_SERVB|nr:hypothetical protein M408DRAFT_238265 [Serendipita vermifera MAFF 305830]